MSQKSICHLDQMGFIRVDYVEPIDGHHHMVLAGACEKMPKSP